MMHATPSTEDNKKGGDGSRALHSSRTQESAGSAAPARPSLVSGRSPSRGTTCGPAAESSRHGNQRKRPRRLNPDNVLSVPGVATSRRRQPLVAALAAAVAAAVLLLPRGAEGQYNADTPLFEENMEKGQAELISSLEGGEYVEEVFHPERQVSTAV